MVNGLLYRLYTLIDVQLQFMGIDKFTVSNKISFVRADIESATTSDIGIYVLGIYCKIRAGRE